MRPIVELFKSKFFEISLILCYLLPPVGILFLFIISFNTIFKILKEKEPIQFSLSSFFLVILLFSTIGAVIEMRNVFLFVDTLMILGYWGIFQRITASGSLVTFQNFRWIVIFGGVYNCLIGWATKWFYYHPILGLLTGTKLLGDIPSKNYSRLIGSSYNPNFTMVLLLFAIAFLLVDMVTRIRRKKWGMLTWQLAILLLLSYGVWSTGSRAGFFAMICLYFLFFLRLSKIMFIGTAILILLQLNRFLDLMPRNDSIDASYLGRETIWMNAIEMWKKHIFFGTTSRGFKYEYMHLFNKDVSHAHNVLLGFFAEYGTIGGVSLIVLLFVTGYKLVTLLFYKKQSHEFLNYFLFSLPIFLLTGIFDEPTFSPQVALPTIILLAYWEKYTKRYELNYRFSPKILSNLNENMRNKFRHQ